MWSLQPAVGQVHHSQDIQDCGLTCITYTVVYNSVYSPVSLIAFTFMAILAFLEFFVYRDTWMKYEYEVDKDFTR